ncbi:MAG: thiol oxidoreductase [Flavobacteriaceae bacterium]|nr:thiol oxidoreductase [Flavobacteriaceae bacterium]
MKKLLMITLSLLALSCSKDNEDEYKTLISEYSGGEIMTTFDISIDLFGRSPNGLSTDDFIKFSGGNSLFRRNWVAAPSSVSSLDGLGPIFNARSCGACHFKDGRATPPDSSGKLILNGLLFRLSIAGTDDHGGPLPDPNYGGQLQDAALKNTVVDGIVRNLPSEGNVRVTYKEEAGKYADGTTYSLRIPNYEFYNLEFGELQGGFMFSPRIGNQLPGLGLLENISEMDILANADVDDYNQDGISGKPNYVWDIENNKMTLGRFGWKANQPSLRQQITGAFNGDMGITSSIFPKDHTTAIQQPLYSQIPNGGEHELSDDSLESIEKYMKLLCVPSFKNHDDEDVLRGREIFDDLKCSSCHIPDFTTTDQGLEPLRNQKIHPYTDLLLHDMGDGLADNRPDFDANGNEWRTPPLWGVGHIERVNGHTFLLHDGRARNAEEAILWHGGEAQQVKENFTKLSTEDRASLLNFLSNL